MMEMGKVHKKGRPHTQMPQLTPSQYDQLLKMPDKDTTSACSASMAGIAHACTVNTSSQEWIVDTGATNHMTYDLDLLTHTSTVSSNVPRKVHLPNGNVTAVSHVGSCQIDIDGVINNVLSIAHFKYNLLLFSKITKELNCSVLFLPNFCVLQDLATRQVRGIGRE